MFVRDLSSGRRNPADCPGCSAISSGWRLLAAVETAEMMSCGAGPACIANDKYWRSCCPAASKTEVSFPIGRDTSLLLVLVRATSIASLIESPSVYVVSLSMLTLMDGVPGWGPE